MTALVTLNLWDEIAAHIIRVTKIWLSCFDRAELAMTTDDLVGLF
jgi:hypothetical protein